MEGPLDGGKIELQGIAMSIKIYSIKKNKSTK
jgi:hypothetical protein